MMKQMKQIATKTLFGAQEIKSYMKRATLTSFGLTMVLFASAFGLGVLVASLTDKPIPESPVIVSSGPTIVDTYNMDAPEVPNVDKINIDPFTLIIQGTQKVAGNFIAVPDIDIAVDASNIATDKEMRGAGSKFGDMKIEDVLNHDNFVIGDRGDFEIDETIIPDKSDQEFEEWEVTESPGVDVSEISENIVYPNIAKKAGIEGLVLINALIGPDGKVLKIKVEHSDNVILNEAAISAVNKSTYTPAIQNGNPCACWISIPIDFRLN